MSLSACTAGNDHENIFTTSDITEPHSESDPADTQAVTDLTVEDVLVNYKTDMIHFLIYKHK